MKPLGVIKEYVGSSGTNELQVLVESGMIEQEKLHLLKRAMSNDVSTLTNAEKKTLVRVVESVVKDHLSAFDTKRPAAYPPEQNIPTVLILKRKAIRVYPDNQKIALYYSQALDKYISIPFGPKSDHTGIHINEDGFPASPFQNPDTLGRDDVGEIRQFLYNKAGYKGKVPSNWKQTPNLVFKHQRALSRTGKEGALPTILAANKANPLATSEFKVGFEKGATIRAYMDREALDRQKVTTSDNILAKNPRSVLKAREKKIKPEPVKSRMVWKPKLKVKPAVNIAPVPTPTVPSMKKPGNPRPMAESTFAKILRETRERRDIDEGIADKVVKGAINAAEIAKKLAPKVGSTVEKGVESAAQGVGNVASSAAKLGGKALRGTGRLVKRSLRGAAGLGAAIGSALVGAENNSKEESPWKPVGDTHQFSDTGRSPLSLTNPVNTSDSGVISGAQLAAQRKLWGKPTNESTNFDRLKSIIEDRNMKIDIGFGDKSITINNSTARKIIKVHESLNKKNKNKLERMINENFESFKKAINFVVKGNIAWQI